MLYDPCIMVARVIVERDATPVFDERFHAGVNIIRGENSSGKSSILNFIFYGLGGDLYEWSDAAQLCSRVTLEVQLNGKIATLSREVSLERGQPMDIFGGDYEASKVVARDEWIRCPYARYQTKESFSQVLFRLLGIPEVANEASGSLTINQILRLLYADQLSPVENLFKFDRLYDSPLIRDAVGRLLAGAYDSELYQNEIARRAARRQFDEINGELRNLYRAFGKAGEGLTLDWVEAEGTRLNQYKNELQKGLEIAERDYFARKDQETLTLSGQEDEYNIVQNLQAELLEATRERDALLLEIADLGKFIENLKQKLQALANSALASSAFGEIRFSSCPACYSPVDQSIADHTCYLCKSPHGSERAHNRLASLVNDTALQLHQSEMLQKIREEEAPKWTSKVEEIRSRWSSASARLAALQRLPSSEIIVRIRDLNRSIGYVERQIENNEHRKILVKEFDELSNKKSGLNKEMTRLETRNEALRASQVERVAKAYTAISDEIKDLLRHDLRRQDAFENPQSVEFDFATNRIGVDGQTYFSASSRVVLKTSFFIGFLVAGLKHQFFRHPRFCIIDTIEDKGMEPQRSHNLQMQIARVSQASKVQHQIIFATTMIAPDLDDEKFTVGKFSTRDDPTLEIGVI